MPARVVIVLIALFAVGCGDVNGALEQQARARSLSTDLLVQFTKGADAANRAVMADTDELSVSFAKEADRAKQTVQNDIDALGPLLQTLSFTDETRMLQDFVARFAEYGALDRRILDLAVENTNLKAQRLSFGSGQAAADEFRKAVDALASSSAAHDAWRIKAVAAEAVSAVREIQVLQAVHIADPDDAKMADIESRMAAWQSVARNNVGTLAALTGARVSTAIGALDRFAAINSEIVSLSRRNTNVRSLALSLDQKRTLTSACEDRARALHDALAKRGYPAGR